ncbi:HpcH/HpaI aldolase family protein [Jannaschia seohaensis]|uniref:2-keto-3-deoxy-L-rhamnonate aldolase RhmA n=1 Tax=Jannaschia seohaensis TaxID=475081 RepID=A0A2Y9AQ69_9RHOB|nr:aldolase/citrate lyase family protein [Jannaschia seohaensis]PWJ18031.1 2-keto-3-deoxy-L-rhamnonate aldolase RhmA [Jannaschia seohaensis]SSA46554.1 2-keto-3-deoxy-L-rhamnonate aldolase RhmA [Jannaschia seohaensis]
MADAKFKTRMLAGEVLAGTFFKTPAHELVEVLAKSGLDFLCLDAEHAPFDHGRMDTCLALTRALGVPALVRVPTGSPMEILKALDGGGLGVVVPHVDSVEKARAVARAAHFGEGGRGYAGSTRWAGFATRGMADVLAQDAETIVIAQIEEPAGVEACEEIAAVDGIDGLFVGPADLSVCYGVTDITAEPVRAAMARVGAACKANGKAFMTFAPNAAACRPLMEQGVTMFFVASEHAFMLQGARAVADALHDMGEAD